jgi:hypothetical protein
VVEENEELGADLLADGGVTELQGEELSRRESLLGPGRGGDLGGGEELAAHILLRVGLGLGYLRGSLWRSAGLDHSLSSVTISGEGGRGGGEIAPRLCGLDF